MFDSISVQQGPRTVTVSERRDVHEHRAPTDKSVALLRELEAAARDAVLHAIRLGDGNELTARALVTRDIFELRITIQFRLNGQQHQVVETIDQLATTPQIIERIRAALADKLAREVLKLIAPEFLKFVA